MCKEVAYAMKWLRSRVLALGLLAVSGWSVADADFLAAREAYRKGDLGALAQYASSMQGEPLGAYPQYWLASRQLETQDEAAVTAFLRANEGSYLAEKLRSEWLKSLGKQGAWPRFRAEYPQLRDTPSTDLLCYEYSARLEAGDSKALAEARTELWFTSKDLPGPCDPVLDALVTSHTVIEADIWDRLRLALENNAQGLARHLSRLLEQEVPASTLNSIVSNPQKYLAGPPPLTTRMDRELAIFALVRLARTDLDAARDSLMALQEELGREKAYAWRMLGFSAARRNDPRALDWLKESKGLPYTDAHQEWRVRAALRAQDWDTVLDGIRSMSEENRNLRTWQYWLARALEAKKMNAHANRILAELSRDDDYYGLLARDRLGPVVGEAQQAYKVGEDDWKRVKANAGLQRALLLYEMELKTEAVREWNWALRGADDRLLLAAAEQANAIGWYDRAIYAAERTQKMHNFSLRYVAPYRDITKTYAAEQGLDEAWVYGLMRQESRFANAARSSVGAGGLMQLMPGTAQWVANKLGVRYRAAMVNDVDTNVQFGTYYLRHVQDRLSGSPVLATAGYNAGPNRARDWQGEQPMEAAVYVECIPFFETRDYVRKVMTNAVYYAMSFGQGRQSITQRMGVIPSKNPQAIEGP